MRCQTSKCQGDRANVVYSSGMAAELCEPCTEISRGRAAELKKSIRVHPIIEKPVEEGAHEQR